MNNLSKNETFLDPKRLGDDHDSILVRSGQIRALDRIREAFVDAVREFFDTDGDEFLKEIGLLRTYTFEGSVSIEFLDEDVANEIQSIWDAMISDLNSATDQYVSSNGGYTEDTF